MTDNSFKDEPPKEEPPKDDSSKDKTTNLNQLMTEILGTMHAAIENGLEKSAEEDKPLSGEEKKKVEIEGSRPMYGGPNPLTVREWFAGQAISGLLANHDRDYLPSELAETAYEYADAMILKGIPND